MTTPTDEAVERVAKAIFREDFPTGHKRGEWRKVSDAMRENYRAAARAAIAAMQPSVADAAKVLLDLLETPSEIAPISGDKIEHVWHETFRQSGFCAVSGFLRAISKETPGS
jgi:hypothetical protein